MHILPKLYIIFPVFFILIIEDIHTQNVSTFAEYGTTIHTGKHTPMWQNSNQHGLSSIKNNTLDNQQRTKTAGTDAEDNGRKSKENGPNGEEITLSGNIAQQC